MSAASAPRRSTRVRGQPANIADEQAEEAARAREEAQVRAVVMRSLEIDEDDLSDEEGLSEEEGSTSEEEEEEDQNADPNVGWVEQSSHVRLPSFTAGFVVVLDTNSPHTELAYLQYFLPPSLIDTMVTNTNLYAASRRAVGWNPTCARELWLFISVNIFMGMYHFDDLHDYWEEETKLRYVVGAFSRNRFKELQRYFHIGAPPAAGAREGVIAKIAPLWDSCKRLFPISFYPPREFTFDESMVAFSGRSNILARIKSKPIPVGYKIWSVASHGYLLNFDLWQPKGSYTDRAPVVHHTVIRLVEPWKNTGRILYMDNLFTSPALCEHLLRMGIRSCGTCRARRKALPPGIKGTLNALQKGEMKVWEKGHLQCLAWYDTKPVLFLSTHRQVSGTKNVSQYRGSQGPSSVTKPLVALDYNKHKTHVDTVDQLRQYYAMDRKHYKTWPSLAWWLMDMCIINAYALWYRDSNSSASQRDFRKALTRQVLAAYPPLSAHKRGRASSTADRGGPGHWLHHEEKKGTCQHCTEGRAGRKEVHWRCVKCQVYLCPEPCMQQWHGW
jgi:hypothetical protein